MQRPGSAGRVWAPSRGAHPPRVIAAVRFQGCLLVWVGACGANRPPDDVPGEPGTYPAHAWFHGWVRVHLSPVLGDDPNESGGEASKPAPSRTLIYGFQQKIVHLNGSSPLQEIHAHQQSCLATAGQHDAFKPRQWPVPDTNTVSRNQSALDR